MRETIKLRPLSSQDAPALFGLIDRNREQLNKFWWERITKTIADSEQFIDVMNALEHGNGAPTRGIVVDEQLVGIEALHAIDWEKRQAAMGYWLDTNFAGRGIATRATKKMADIAFGDLALETLTISACESNHASRLVAEKCEFTLTGINTQATWQSEEAVGRVAHYQLRR